VDCNQRKRGLASASLKSGSMAAFRPEAAVGDVCYFAATMADLQRQVGTLTRELKEANERQTETAEVLQVINSLPGNLAPVFRFRQTSDKPRQQRKSPAQRLSIPWSR